MKKIIVTLLFFISAVSFAQVGPQATFQKKLIVLEDVLEGTVVRVVWHFTNTGDAPLLINSAVPSCGCTDVIFPKKAVAPGAQDSIVATFDTTDRPLFNAKGINMTSNAGEISLVFEVMVHAKE